MRSGQTRHFPALRVPMVLVVGSLLLGACLNASVVVVGETPAPPPPPPPEFTVLVVDDGGAPVAGATVELDGAATQAGGDGLVAAVWEDVPIQVRAHAPGFHAADAEVVDLPEEPFRVDLQPVVLTGRVITSAGAGIPGALVRLGDSQDTTGQDGSFRLERAIPGEVIAGRPAWMGASVAWDGDADGVELRLEPRVAKALHVTGWVPQNAETWSELLAIADTTEINAMVLDLKDESGRVYYESSVPLAQEVEATRDFYDLPQIATTIHDRDLYLIGRIVAFQDPQAARARTDLAILDTTTGGPFHKGEQYFLDPTDPVTRQYALDLAAEACQAGVQEIQFDYVRFPDGFGTDVRFDGGAQYIGAYNDPESGAARVEVIAGFLSSARELLHPLGCAVAADVFAITLTVSDDQGIGQRPEDISASVDVLSPMIYPDHYSDGSFGYDQPEDYPGEVVDAALSTGMERIDAASIMRPWLADYYYGPAEVRAEIDAAEAYGIGWMLWNANSNHTPGALEPEEDGPGSDGGGPPPD